MTTAKVALVTGAGRGIGKGCAAMLAQAETGVLFRPPDNVMREFHAYPVCREYAELKEIFINVLDVREAPEPAIGLTG